MVFDGRVFGVVIGIGFAFSYILDAQGILYIAVIFALVMNVGSYWYSDKLVIATTGAHEADIACNFGTTQSG